MLQGNGTIGELEHVGLIMKDIAGAKELFGQKLGLPIVDASSKSFATKVGGTILRIEGMDSPQAEIGRRGVHHVALRVGSLEAVAKRLAKMGVQLSEAQPPGTDGRKALWTEPASTFGIPIQFVESGALLNFPLSDQNGIVERVDHLGVAVHNHVHARQLFAGRMGFEIESTQVDSEVLIPVETTSNDKYGAHTRTREPIPAVGAGIMAIFVTIGDLDLEIMQPLSEANIRVPLGTVPGTVGQDQGAIARFLAKRGEGLLHICFRSPDIRKAIDTVTSAGIRMIDPVPRPGGRAGQIAFMDRRDTEGVLMHFVERTRI